MHNDSRHGLKTVKVHDSDRHSLKSIQYSIITTPALIVHADLPHTLRLAVRQMRHEFCFVHSTPVLSKSAAANLSKKASSDLNFNSLDAFYNTVYPKRLKKVLININSSEDILLKSE